MRSSAQRVGRFQAPIPPAYRTIRGWALGVLLEAHAIRECHQHGHMKDSTDPHALERAMGVAREEPFPGTSSAQCLAAIDEAMNSIGDACPECD
jgi:hypothetical protein